MPNLGILRFYLMCNVPLDVIWMVYWVLKILTETSLALLNKRDLVV
jgi:hypothetical protein